MVNVFLLGWARPVYDGPISAGLDTWLPDPALRVRHSRVSSASAEKLWEAARAVRLGDTRRLGRIVRWRIPGTPADISFDELFRRPPFIVLEEPPGGALVSGLVGRIWTLRRDYPQLGSPAEFLEWDTPGTARVVFANWVEGAGGGRHALVSETRVDPIGMQGRLGVRALGPVVRAFQGLIGSDALAAAVALAER